MLYFKNKIYTPMSGKIYTLDQLLKTKFQHWPVLCSLLCLLSAESCAFVGAAGHAPQPKSSWVQPPRPPDSAAASKLTHQSVPAALKTARRGGGGGSQTCIEDSVGPASCRLLPQLLKLCSTVLCSEHVVRYVQCCCLIWLFGAGPWFVGFRGCPHREDRSQDLRSLHVLDFHTRLDGAAYRPFSSLVMLRRMGREVEGIMVSLIKFRVHKLSS